MERGSLPPAHHAHRLCGHDERQGQEGDGLPAHAGQCSHHSHLPEPAAPPGRGLLPNCKPCVPPLGKAGCTREATVGGVSPACCFHMSLTSGSRFQYGGTYGLVCIQGRVWFPPRFSLGRELAHLLLVHRGCGGIADGSGLFATFLPAKLFSEGDTIVLCQCGPFCCL